MDSGLTGLLFCFGPWMLLCVWGLLLALRDYWKGPSWAATSNQGHHPRPDSHRRIQAPEVPRSGSNHEHHPHPDTRGTVGVVCTFAGWALVLLVLALVVVEAVYFGRVSCVTYFVGCLAGGGALWMIKHGRRLLQPNVDEALAADPRLPILLLHSFEDDELEMEEPLFGWWNPARMLTWLFNRPQNRWEFEHMLVTSLRQYGPVIAIGKPGEKLPPLGASRMYMSDQNWQEEIRQRIQECGFVVMLVAATEGLLWELEELVRQNAPEKLLLVFPPLKDMISRWQVWRKRAESILQVSLPPLWGACPLYGIFSKEWKCEIITSISGKRSAKDYMNLFPHAVSKVGE